MPYPVENKMGEDTGGDGGQPGPAAGLIKIKPSQGRKNEEKQGMAVYMSAAEGFSEENCSDRLIDDIG